MNSLSYYLETIVNHKSLFENPSITDIFENISYVIQFQYVKFVLFYYLNLN